jgi:hypothetical protein
MLKHKWFAKDGSVFSEQIKSKHSQEFRLGKEYEYHEVVAFNVGHRMAKHLVDLHNASLE